MTGSAVQVDQRDRARGDDARGPSDSATADGPPAQRRDRRRAGRPGSCATAVLRLHHRAVQLGGVSLRRRAGPAARVPGAPARGSSRSTTWNSSSTPRVSSAGPAAAGAPGRRSGTAGTDHLAAAHRQPDRRHAADIRPTARCCRKRCGWACQACFRRATAVFRDRTCRTWGASRAAYVQEAPPKHLLPYRRSDVTRRSLGQPAGAGWMV